jgi:hypothetical protein
MDDIYMISKRCISFEQILHYVQNDKTTFRMTG